MVFTLDSFLVEYAFRIAVILLFVAALGVLLRLSVNCIEARPNAFEPFDGGPTLADYTSRILKLEAVKDSLSDDISELDDLVDETCGIVGHVKEAYIGNNSAPLDDSENSLPKDVQKIRMERRKVRAAKRFDDEQAVFGTVIKKTLLECFKDGADTKTDEDAESEAAATAERNAATADAQRDLSAAVDDVTRILDTVQVKAALLKSQQVIPTLQFTGKYLKQAGEGVSSAPAVNMEPFEGGIREGVVGLALIKSADELLKRAGTIRKTVEDLKAAVQQQKDAVKALKQVQSRGIAPPL